MYWNPANWLEIAASYKEVTDKLGIPYVFKHLLIKPTVHPFPLSGDQVGKGLRDSCGDQADL